ncbi:MAG: DUF2807 domain-containing protein [Saprospiraceae bacterium]|nr:DUF2807 domain-containing protein [Saprospiraceae bacterium]
MKNSNKILLGIIVFLIAAGLYAIFTLKSGINKAQEEAIKGNSQVKKELRTLANFDAIHVSGQFNIILKKGEQKVEIEADENILSYLITEVNNGELDLREKEDQVLDFTVEPTVYISMEELSSLIMSGVSDVTMQDSFYTENANFSISGASNSTFYMGCEKLKINVSGVGEVFLKGSAQSVDMGISGSGALHGEKFKCEDAYVRVSGTGEASIYVSNDLDAGVSGTGAIYYYGNPASKITNISGVGEIIGR